LDVSRWETPQSDFFHFISFFHFILYSSCLGHILVDRRRHWNVLDVRSFRAADCDTDHYLVVAKVRERLALNKQRSCIFHRERFSCKKLNEVEGQQKYHIEVSNSLQLYKIWTLRRKLLVLGKPLERLSKFHPKRV
jgi:hypothetical protein